VLLPGIYDGRNRTFWIGFEGCCVHQTGNTDLYRTVPTPAERRGDFSALLGLGPRYRMYDPRQRRRRRTFQPATLPRQPHSANHRSAGQSFAVVAGAERAGTSDGQNNYFRAPREVEQ
jgi:hypothetical protein